MATTNVMMVQNQPGRGISPKNNEEEVDHEIIVILTSIKRDTNPAWSLASYFSLIVIFFGIELVATVFIWFP